MSQSLFFSPPFQSLAAGRSFTHKFYPHEISPPKFLNDLRCSSLSSGLFYLLDVYSLKKPDRGWFGEMIPTRYKGSGQPK